MAKEIILPQLEKNMRVATIIDWFVDEGDFVKKGTPLLEVMTDTDIIELKAESAGILLKKIGEIDEEYPINAVVAYLGEAGEQIAEDTDAFVAHLEKIGIRAQEVPKIDEKVPDYDLRIDQTLPERHPDFSKDGDNLSDPEMTWSQTEKNKIVDEIKNASKQKQAIDALKTVRATPAARRRIREKKIDLKTIMPTGPKGRIQLADVEKTISQIKAKGYAREYEPIVVETKLETLIGHPENTTKVGKVFRVAKGQSLKKLIDDHSDLGEKEEVIKQKEIQRNPDLDFVPFVDNGTAQLRDEIVVKPTPIIDGEVRILTKDQTPKWKESLKYQPLSEEKEDRILEKKEVKQAQVIREQTADKVDQGESVPSKDGPCKDGPSKDDRHLENTITLTIEIDMTEAKDLRRRISKKIESQAGYRASYTDFFLLASARALLKHPVINSRLEEGQVISHDYISIGLALGQDDGQPVIPNIQALDFVDLVRARGKVLKTVKGHGPTTKDLPESTFTIANLGMYGVHDFTAIIHSPNCAILSLGQVVQRMRVIHGEPQVRFVMKASLNLDQRIANGIEGAKFLQELKEDVENPSILLF